MMDQQHYRHHLYLHHDQQGSTRLLTGSTGKSEGAYTYTPYGAVQEHTGTSMTLLGYDGQYTSFDTGLIYLRTRTYDPTTAQFPTVDPLVQFTRTLYTYAQDNPVNRADLTGLCTGLGPAPAGCTGGANELGPHVFCEPTKHEIEESQHEIEAEEKEKVTSFVSSKLEAEETARKLGEGPPPEP